MNELYPMYETWTDVTQEINEDTNGKKNYYLKGIFTECDTPNNNKRVYPFALIEREVKNRIKPKIEKGIAFGEFGHPKTLQEMAEIEPSRISHRICELEADGKNYVGKSVLIPEGLGKVAIGMVETGGVLSVSSRGVGRLKKNSNIVEDSYNMYTYDLVINPGMKSANQTAILENKELLVNELQYYSEDEWKMIERNRHGLLEGVLFSVDLFSMLNELKNLK